MLNKLKLTTLCAAAAILTACATSTPYQPSFATKSGYGFDQQNIERDRTRITFSGNSLTDRETVETYLLYRAAEATLEAGYDYFELAERDTEARTRISPTGFHDPFYGPYFGYSFYGRRGWSPYIGGHRFHRRAFRRGFGNRPFGYGPRHGFGYDPFFDNYDFREITKYKAMAEVKFKRGSKPSSQANAFNAREVIENLQNQIKYPEE